MVDDVDEIISRLAETGVYPDNQQGLDAHPHRPCVYFCDDNGLAWEFVQYLSEQSEQANDYSL